MIGVREIWVQDRLTTVRRDRRDRFHDACGPMDIVPAFRTAGSVFRGPGGFIKVRRQVFAVAGRISGTGEDVEISGGVEKRNRDGYDAEHETGHCEPVCVVAVSASVHADAA